MIYAIGDIHGQIEMLEAALELVARDGGQDAQIIFLGDFTDRGLNSCAVIERLLTGQNSGQNWAFIKGNHDRFFSHYVQFGKGHDPRVASGIHWLNPRLGGTNTLASYGLIFEVDFASHSKGTLEQVNHVTIDGKDLPEAEFLDVVRRAVPSSHLSFLDSLPLTLETDDLLFVHAGIRAGIALKDQDPEDLLWIRGAWLEDTRDHGKLIVHGHTALDIPQHYGNRVNLDGGAGYGRPLVPAVFEGRDCWLLTSQGRQALLPS